MKPTYHHLNQFFMKTTFTLLFSGLLFFTAIADTTRPVIPNRSQTLAGVESARYVDNNHFPQFIKFKQDINILPEEGILWLKKQLNLTENTDFELVRETKDEFGYSHARYQQTLHGVAVIGGVYIIHSKNGRIEMMNGELFSVNEEHAPKPVFSKDQAIATAMQHFPSEVYGWEIKLPGHEETRSEYPAPELVYVPQHLDFILPEYRAAYKMDVYALAPLKRAWVYIDVETGMIIAEENRICHIDEEGTANTFFSGTQTVITDNTGSIYQSREDGRGVETLTDNSVLYTDDDNNWESIPGDMNEFAMDGHYGSEVYHDMLEEDYGRNSMDDAGHILTAIIYANQGFNNAFWDGSVSTYGDGDGVQFRHFASPEIVGHEYQHGTTQFSAGLIYNGESGALNESFSDIFGHMNDIRARGEDEALYIVGEQTVIDGQGIRNMADPHLFENPGTYGGDFWNDFNGVHTNSGVQNHWFHILSEGEIGTNDLGNDYSVAGLGTAAVSQIAMRNLTVYLTPSSNYADAAFYARQAAIDIYGGCATEIAEVVNAWYAVGVGVEVSTDFSVNFAAQTIHCDLPVEVIFQNLSTLAETAVWDFGDGGTSTDYTPTHVYENAGTYDVKLIATGCDGVSVDSLMQTSYIIIDPEATFCDTSYLQTNGIETITECSGILVDPGGEGPYPNGVNSTMVINPPSNAVVTLTFPEFSLESGYDFLTLYDGEDTSAPILGSYDGTSLQGQSIESSGGAITLVFTTDGSVTFPGFVCNYATAGGNTVPVAGFSISDTNPALNAPVSFTDTSTDSGGWTYDFGDGNQSFTSNPTHSYTAAGTYTVSQIVETCIGADTTTLSLTVQEGGTFNINPDSLCVTLLAGETADEIVTITNSGTGQLYYSAEEIIEGQTISSTVAYFEPGETFTEHAITGLSAENGFLNVSFIFNGDFDDATGQIIIGIEGDFFEFLAVENAPNGTDIIYEYTFTDEAQLDQWLADGILYAFMVNPFDVQIGQGGDDTHTVTASTGNTAFLEIDPMSGLIAPGSSQDINVHLDSEGLETGTYTYDVEMQTGDPNLTSVMFPVKLIVLAFPQTDFSSNTTASCDGFVQFYDETINAPLSWEWNFGDGTSSTEASPLHQYLDSGVYDVSLIACNDLGCDTLLQEAYVNINLNGAYCDTLIMAINGNQTMTECTGVILDSGGIDGEYSNNTNYTAYIQPSQMGLVELNFLSFNLETGWDYLYVYDGEDASAPLIGTYSGTQLPNGGTITSSGSALTVIFTTDGSVTRPGFHIEYQCIEAMPPTANFETGPIDGCSNLYYFNNTSEFGTQYYWEFGDGSSSTDENPNHTFFELGEHTVTLTATNDLGSDEREVTIMIDEMPFDLSLDMPEVMLVDTPIEFDFNSSSAAIAWTWDLGAEGVFVNLNLTLSFDEAGDYPVILTATNNEGCEVRIEETITILLESDTDNPDILSSFEIFPNPTTGNVTIAVDLPQSGDTELLIYNALGQLLRSEKQSNSSSYQQTLDLNNLPAGQYFLLLSVNGEVMGRERLVIE